MLAELLTGVPHDLQAVDETIPLVGRHRSAPRLLPGGGRLIKTHEPCRKTAARAIYIVRDVRDVAPSYQRLGAAEGQPSVPFQEFLRRFSRGEAGSFGTWARHIDSWLDAADAGKDVLVVRYEDMVRDTPTELRRMAAFLGLEVSDQQVAQAVATNGPDRMRERAARALDPVLAFAAVGHSRDGVWRDLYGPEDLELLTPNAGAMRRLGYRVTDELVD